MTKDFIKLVQRHIGSKSIGPSTARGMGPKKTIPKVRTYLGGLDLRPFKVRSEAAFLRVLERRTLELKMKMPRPARHWGSARKFLNIFLRNCLYDRYICNHYGLQILEPWLEVPLDSQVAKGLKSEPGADFLPRWKTVIGLERELSEEYQAFATKVALAKGLKRVHLDLVYWRGNARGAR